VTNGSILDGYEKFIHPSPIGSNAIPASKNVSELLAHMEKINTRPDMQYYFFLKGQGENRPNPEGISAEVHIATIMVNFQCCKLVAILMWLFCGYFRTPVGYQKMLNAVDNGDSCAHMTLCQLSIQDKQVADAFKANAEREKFNNLIGKAEVIAIGNMTTLKPNTAGCVQLDKNTNFKNMPRLTRQDIAKQMQDRMPQPLEFSLFAYQLDADGRILGDGGLISFGRDAQLRIICHFQDKDSESFAPQQEGTYLIPAVGGRHHTVCIDESEILTEVISCSKLTQIALNAESINRDIRVARLTRSPDNNSFTYDNNQREIFYIEGNLVKRKTSYSTYEAVQDGEWIIIDYTAPNVNSQKYIHVKSGCVVAPISGFAPTDYQLMHQSFTANSQSTSQYSAANQSANRPFDSGVSHHQSTCSFSNPIPPASQSMSQHPFRAIKNISPNQGNPGSAALTKLPDAQITAQNDNIEINSTQALSCIEVENFVLDPTTSYGGKAETLHGKDIKKLIESHGQNSRSSKSMYAYKLNSCGEILYNEDHNTSPGSPRSNYFRDPYKIYFIKNSDGTLGVAKTDEKGRTNLLKTPGTYLIPCKNDTHIKFQINGQEELVDFVSCGPNMQFNGSNQWKNGQLYITPIYLDDKGKPQYNCNARSWECVLKDGIVYQRSRTIATETPTLPGHYMVVDFNGIPVGNQYITIGKYGAMSQNSSSLDQYTFPMYYKMKATLTVPPENSEDSSQCIENAVKANCPFGYAGDSYQGIEVLKTNLKSEFFDVLNSSASNVGPLLGWRMCTGNKKLESIFNITFTGNSGAIIAHDDHGIIKNLNNSSNCEYSLLFWADESHTKWYLAKFNINENGVVSFSDSPAPEVPSKRNYEQPRCFPKKKKRSGYFCDPSEFPNTTYRNCVPAYKSGNEMLCGMNSVPCCIQKNEQQEVRIKSSNQPLNPGIYFFKNFEDTEISDNYICVGDNGLILNESDARSKFGEDRMPKNIEKLTSIRPLSDIPSMTCAEIAFRMGESKNILMNGVQILDENVNIGDRREISFTKDVWGNIIVRDNIKTGMYLVFDDSDKTYKKIMVGNNGELEEWKKLEMNFSKDQRQTIDNFSGIAVKIMVLKNETVFNSNGKRKVEIRGDSAILSFSDNIQEWEPSYLKEGYYVIINPNDSSASNQWFQVLDHRGTIGRSTR
jgi:hypothetical protein